jgi:hypothetical protein
MGINMRSQDCTWETATILCKNPKIRQTGLRVKLVSRFSGLSQAQKVFSTS